MWWQKDFSLLLHQELDNATKKWISDGSPCNCFQQIETDVSSLLAVVAMYFLSVTSSVANVILLLAVLPNRKLRTHTNILLASNAISDFFVGAYNLASTATVVLLKKCWHFKDDWICTFLHTSKEYFLGATMTHMACIASNRYIRVLRPSFYRTHIKNRAGVEVALCWILPTITSYVRVFTPYFLEIYPFDKGQSGADVYDSCSGDRSVIRSFSGVCIGYSLRQCNCVLCCSYASMIFQAVFQYSLPIIFMLGSYGRIMMMAYRRVKKAEIIKERL